LGRRDEPWRDRRRSQKNKEGTAQRRRLPRAEVPPAASRPLHREGQGSCRLVRPFHAPPGATVAHLAALPPYGRSWASRPLHSRGQGPRRPLGPTRALSSSPRTGHARAVSAALAFRAPRVPTSSPTCGRVAQQRDGADEPAMALAAAPSLLISVFSGPVVMAPLAVTRMERAGLKAWVSGLRRVPSGCRHGSPPSGLPCWLCILEP
jgi:hypothetical protein